MIAAQTGCVRMLLVEDEPANRALVRAILARAASAGIGPVVIDEAESIADARARLARVRADLVLLDVRLPDGDGLDLAAEILDGSPDAPRVIVVSASVLPADRSRAEAVGVDGFLAKPFVASQLLEVVREVAGGPPVG